MFTNTNNQHTINTVLVVHKFIDVLHWKTCTRIRRQSFLRYCRSCKVSMWANSTYPYPLWLRGVVGRWNAKRVGLVTNVSLMWRLYSPSSLWSRMDKEILPENGHSRVSSQSDCIMCTNREMWEPYPVSTPFGLILESKRRSIDLFRTVALRH